MHLLFDLGRTNLRTAISSDRLSFSTPVVWPTPASLPDLLERLVESAGGEKLLSVVGGVSRKLWSFDDLQQQISQNFACPVVIENDAALAALGEEQFGHHHPAKIFAYLTVSSGVGGARIVNGQIDTRTIGFEPGEQVISYQPSTEQFVTLEDLISGLSLSQKLNRQPFEIAATDSVWQELAQWLAVGLHNLIALWSPEVIVVGGSMMKIPGISLEQTGEYLKKMPTIFNTLPVIQSAALGDSGGLWGALALARLDSQ